MSTDEHLHENLYRLERPSQESVGLELAIPDVGRFLASALPENRLPQGAEIAWRVVSLRAWAMHSFPISSRAVYNVTWMDPSRNILRLTPLRYNASVGHDPNGRSWPEAVSQGESRMPSNTHNVLGERRGLPRPSQPNG